MANSSFQTSSSPATSQEQSVPGRNPYAQPADGIDALGIKAKAPVSTVAKSGVIDVSGAANSAQALLMVEEALLELQGISPKTIDLNAGHLLLTRAVLARVALFIKKHHIALHTVYSKVPQTQQAALDEGYFVKDAPTRPQPSSIEQLHRHLEQGTAAQAAMQKSVSPPQQTLVEALVSHQENMPRSQAAFNVPSQLSPHANVAPAPSVLTSELAESSLDSVDLLFDFDATASLRAETSSGFAPIATPNTSPTLLVKGTLRSGQVLRYAGNLVVLGDAHAGSEITADGDIVIWGELRGIAHAGASGYGQAEIRAMKIEAIQLRIGDHIARRPDRMFYHKPLANQLPTPEVARVYQGEIRVFKESLGIR